MADAYLQKFCLGTAQFGLDYGISNTKGQVEPDEIEKILKMANQVGINTLDTASEYGQADQVMGGIIQARNLNFDIMAKSPKFLDQGQSLEETISNINSHIELSLKTLNANGVSVFYVRNLDGFIHRYGNEAIAFFNALKTENRIKKIGVSVYSRTQINKILECFTPDVVQIPFSVLDQRLKMDGTLAMLSEKNIEIHVRSIFTQGLIFIPSNDLSPFFDPIKPDLQRIQAYIESNNMTALQAALHFVFSQPEISKIIIGLTSLKELEDIISITENAPEDIDWSSFALYDDHILNPQNWG